MIFKGVYKTMFFHSSQVTLYHPDGHVSPLFEILVKSKILNPYERRDCERVGDHLQLA